MRRTCFLLTALLAACALPTGGDDDPNVAYDVDRASYGRDQAVSTVMVNHTGEVAGYNLCISTLERRVGGGFRRVERTPDGCSTWKTGTGFSMMMADSVAAACVAGAGLAAASPRPFWLDWPRPP